MARAPVGLGHEARSGRAGPRRTPTTISSMIASGRSERGLSDVTHTRSAERAAISPMIGRLVAVAVAAAAEHDARAGRA